MALPRAVAESLHLFASLLNSIELVELVSFAVSSFESLQSKY